MTTDLLPRPLEPTDLPGLLAIQLACYGAGFVESGDVFARRIASPAGCSLVLERQGQVVAYLAAYRSARGKVTALGGDFESVEGTADTLYLHDLAVHPGCGGQGLGGVLLRHLYARAAREGLRHSALVAVQGARSYWERLGYAPAAVADGPQRLRLAGYGEGAVYMARPLD